MGKLIAYSQISLTMVSDLTPSQTPPENPIFGDIWVDSSVTPPITRQWDGDKWILLNQNEGYIDSIQDEWVTQNYTDGGLIVPSSFNGNTVIHKDKTYKEKQDGNIEITTFEPSFEHPANICSVFDSENLFIGHSLENGYWPFEDSLSENPNADYSGWTRTTDDLTVIPDTYYRISFDSPATKVVVLFYEPDENLQPVYSNRYEVLDSNNTIFLTPGRCTKIRLDFDNTTGHVQVEKSQFPVIAEGKNLIAASNFKAENLVITRDNDDNGALNMISSKFGECVLNQVVSLKRNTKHSLSCFFNSQDSNTQAMLSIYPLNFKKEKYPILNEAGENTDKFYKTASFTLSDMQSPITIKDQVYSQHFFGEFTTNAEFSLYSIEIKFNNSAANISSNIANMQIEIGSFSKYWNYKSSTLLLPMSKNLPSSLLFDETLGNQKITNTVDFTNGIHSSYINTIFFDGSEPWEKLNDVGNYFCFAIPFDSYGSGAADTCSSNPLMSYCSVLKFKSGLTEEEGYYIDSVNQKFVAVVLKSRLLTENHIVEWCELLKNLYNAHNPVRLMYLLKNRVITNINKFLVNEDITMTSSLDGTTNLHGDTHVLPALYSTFYSFFYSKIVQSQVEIKKTNDQIKEIISNTTIETENGEISIKQAYMELSKTVENVTLTFGEAIGKTEEDIKNNKKDITTIQADIKGLSVSTKNSTSDNLIPNSAGLYDFGTAISVSNKEKVSIQQMTKDSEETTSGAYWELSRTSQVPAEEIDIPVSVTWNNTIRLVPDTEYSINFKYQFEKSGITAGENKDFAEIRFGIFGGLTGKSIGEFQIDENGLIVPAQNQNGEYVGYNSDETGTKCLTETGNVWVDFQKSINYYKDSKEPMLRFKTPPSATLDNVELKLSFLLNGYGTFRISDFVIVQGSYISVWRQYPDELKTGVVSISGEGIRIEKEFDPTSSDEDQNFRGVYTNKNTTYTKIIRDSEGKEIDESLIADFNINGAYMGDTEINGTLTVSCDEISYPSLKVIPNSARKSIMFTVISG